MIYIYRHIRLDKQQVFYVGIGSGKTYKRAFSKRGRNNYWKRVVAKTNYDVEIMIHCNSWGKACVKEIEFIALYKRKCDGGTLCNITTGGEGNYGRRVTIEEKAHLSNVLTGIPKTEQMKDKLRSFRLGRPVLQETREKIRKKLEGIKFSEERKLGLKGRNPSVQCSVLNLETGIFYDSITQAATAHNISTDYLQMMVSGTRKNKTALTKI